MNSIQRMQTSPRMSQAVTANGFVFLAGQVADNLQGDIAKQTQQVLEKIERLLQEAGSDKSTLISVNMWLADITHFNAMNDVYENWLGGRDQPTRACVQSTLADPNYLIEITATALLNTGA
jgi:enamine deaminase RidA (YjgF/YER057c/UK114 family)